MAAYYRKKRKWKERYTIEDKRRYWDQKTLENPDQIPSDYDYGVPKVPAMQAGPYSSEFGLSDSVAQVLTYYRDKNAEEPNRFKSRIKENLGDLGSTILGTLFFLGHRRHHLHRSSLDTHNHANRSQTGKISF
jgi:hypothetical protein